MRKFQVLGEFDRPMLEIVADRDRSFGLIGNFCLEFPKELLLFAVGKFMTILVGCIVGFLAWFLVSYLAAGMFTVEQNERAVKTSFGRAERIKSLTTLADPV